MEFCIRYLCWFSEASYNRTRPLSLCRCLSWNIMLEVYVLLKLVKMCRDAVLGSQSLSRRTHLLPSPHLQLQSPPPLGVKHPALPTTPPTHTHVVFRLLSLSPSLPPSTLCSPPFKSYVWPCACPELAPSPGETRFDPKFGRTMTREEGRPPPWFTCAPLAGRGRFVASICPHYRMNIFGPGALFGWHGWKKQGLGLLSFVLGQWEEVTRRVALEVAVTVHTTWNIFFENTFWYRTFLNGDFVF